MFLKYSSVSSPKILFLPSWLQWDINIIVIYLFIYCITLFVPQGTYMSFLDLYLKLAHN